MYKETPNVKSMARHYYSRFRLVTPLNHRPASTVSYSRSFTCIGIQLEESWSTLELLRYSRRRRGCFGNTLLAPTQYTPNYLYPAKIYWTNNWKTRSCKLMNAPDLHFWLLLDSYFSYINVICILKIYFPLTMWWKIYEVVRLPHHKSIGNIYENSALPLFQEIDWFTMWN